MNNLKKQKNSAGTSVRQVSNRQKKIKQQDFAMNVRLSILGAVVGVGLCSCSSTVYKHIRWQEKAVIVDGQAADWPSPLRFYNSNGKLAYELSNDAQNLYIAIATTDRGTMHRIMRQGITIQLDTLRGKHRIPLKLRLPYHDRFGIDPFSENPSMDAEQPMPNNRAIGQGHHHGKPSSASAEQRPLPMEGDTATPRPMHDLQLLAKGLVGASAGDSVLNQENAYGISFGVGRGDERFFCELRIPFAAFYKSKLSVPDTAHALQVSFKLPAMSTGAHRPSMGGGGDQMGGGGFHAGMGGMNGGGMGGGGMRGGGMGHGMPPGEGREGGMGEGSSSQEVNIELKFVPAFVQ